jgi:hypothetical protein
MEGKLVEGCEPWIKCRLQRNPSLIRTDAILAAVSFLARPYLRLHDSRTFQFAATHSAFYPRKCAREHTGAYKPGK